MKNLNGVHFILWLVAVMVQVCPALVHATPAPDKEKHEKLARQLERAEELLQNGEFDQNILELSALLRQYTADADEWKAALHPLFTKLVASYGNNGQLEEVEKTLKRQFLWAKRYGGSSLDLGKLFHNYGQVCLMQKNFSHAINALRIALIFKKHSLPFDLKTTIVTYRELAFAHYRSFNFELAGKYFQTALALTKKLKKPDAELESSIINKYTSLLYANDDIETSRSLLEYSKKLPFPNEYQRIDAILSSNLQLLDHVYIPANNFEEARQQISQSRQILQQHPEFKSAYDDSFIINEGIIEFHEKNYRAALAKFSEAIDPDDKELLYSERDYAVDNCLYMMFESAFMLKQTQLAEKYLKAYKSIREIDLANNPLIKLENELLEIKFRCSQNASPEYESKTLELLKNHQINIYSPLQLSEFIRKPKLEEILQLSYGIFANFINDTIAARTAENMIALTKRMLEFRNMKQSTGLSSSISIENYRTENTLIEQALHLCKILSDATGSETCAHDALLFMERDKSNQLYMSVKRATLSAGTNIPSSVKELENKVSMQVRQYMAQNLAGGDNSQDIVEIQQNYRKLIDGILRNYPEYFNEKYKNDLLADDDILKSHKLSNSSFIEYFTTDSVLYAVTGSTGGKLHFSATQTGSHGKFKQMLKDFSALCSNKPDEHSKENISEFVRLSAALKEILWTPSEKFLSENVILMCDNALSNISFELLTGKSDKNAQNWKSLPYLLKNYNISYSPSLQFLKLDSPARSQTRKDFLGIAYSPPQPNSMNFTPLNYANREVEQISETLQGDVFTNEKSSGHSILQHAGNYSILHLACHAKSDSVNGNQSFLVLSNAADNSPEIVYAHTFYSSQLNNQLVVLSACESALGQAYTGEGVVGLTRSFFYTGARSVLSTLWQVSDFQAGEILGAFYKNLINKHDKSYSLAESKRKYINSATSQYAHPFYWASFVITGDPESLSLGGNYQTMLLYAGSLLAILAAFIVYRRLR